MILYLVRHGIAIDPTDPTAPSDPERYLTAEGVKKTRMAALGLCVMGVKPNILISSPYVRATQTAEIFAEALEFPPENIRSSEALRPAGNPADFIKEISRLRAKEVMCFGHAPQLDHVIAQLAGARGIFTAIKKVGVACFDQAAAHGRWELLWIVTPKLLRQLAK